MSSSAGSAHSRTPSGPLSLWERVRVKAIRCVAGLRQATVRSARNADHLLRASTLLLSSVVIASGCATAPPPKLQPLSDNTAEPVRARPIDQAIDDGIAFLIQTQNPDGSWGTGLQTRGTEIYSMVPGSHDAYRVGTSGLATMALGESIRAGRDASKLRAAYQRGLQYLMENGEARRDNGPLLYNTWAHIYALQALAIELQHNPTPPLRTAVEYQLDQMKRFATYQGGWNYYDFEAHTQEPSLPPTSFQTAAGLVALHEARKAGVDVPQRMIDLAIARVEETRMPDGSYLYGSNYKYVPRLPANMLRGSIGRVQSNNFALWLMNSKRVGQQQAVEGLKVFFENHEWIEMGRKRPYPHEAWYQNSGYYYYFGHYYAGLIVERLPTPQRAEAQEKLSSFILPLQESDGSWWDYAMWDYHKPYGTAYAVMTLLRCRPEVAGSALRTERDVVRTANDVVRTTNIVEHRKS